MLLRLADKSTYGEGMEPFLPCSVPDLVANYTVLESALLSQKCGSDCRLLVGLKVIGDLDGETYSVDGQCLRHGIYTNKTRDH